jgi:hypothetical protein
LFLPNLVFSALIPFVFHVPTEPVEALPQPQRAVPGRIGQVLAMVHTLIAYGRNLAATLQLHAPAPHLLPYFDFIALAFDTSNLPLILTRITRGLLRAAALQERLRQRAARGHDFKTRPGARCQPSQHKPRDARPAVRRPAPARGPFIYSPPTLEQIAAEDRRRPIAAVLADICRDLGIDPAQLDHAAWVELCRDIIDYRGNLVTLQSTRWHRTADHANWVGRKSEAHSAVPTEQPLTTLPAPREPSPQSKTFASTGPP